MTKKEIINEIKCILSELNNGEDAVSYLTQNDVKWLNENIKALEQEHILDKIRVEIEQIVSRYSISRERGGMGQVEWSDRLIKESEVLKILDKYKAETEDKK